MFRRLLAAVAVSLLLIGLSSCRSDPTVAAYVGDDQITVAELDDYVEKAAADPLSATVVSRYRGEIKPMLVSMLVYLSLLRQAADAEDVSVTAGEIAQAKAVLEPQRSTLGDARLLLPLDEFAQLQAYQAKMGQWATAGGVDQAAASRKYSEAMLASERANTVTVNPRFGTFDIENVPDMLSAETAILPSPSPSTQP